MLFLYDFFADDFWFRQSRYFFTFAFATLSMFSVGYLLAAPPLVYRKYKPSGVTNKVSSYPSGSPKNPNVFFAHDFGGFSVVLFFADDFFHF